MPGLLRNVARQQSVSLGRNSVPTTQGPSSRFGAPNQSLKGLLALMCCPEEQPEEDKADQNRKVDDDGLKHLWKLSTPPQPP